MLASAAYNRLLELEKERGLLCSLLELAEWDESTYMPSGGDSLRSEQKGFLANRIHALITQPEFGDCLNSLNGSDFLRQNSLAKANVRGLQRIYDAAMKTPAALVEEVARLSTPSQAAWAEARKANDFSLFQPYLEKMVSLRQQEARALCDGRGLYDTLLDQYEPGATTEQIESVFRELKAAIVPLLGVVKSAKQGPDLSLLTREYPEDSQRDLSLRAMDCLGFNRAHGRLDVAHHPFCRGFFPGDVRLTTRYDRRNLRDGLYSTIHETGHGLYEQGLPGDQWPFPAGRYCSMGIHESQSRLWENQVARSSAFWAFFYPEVQKRFPAATSGISQESFTAAVNSVQLSYIRTESDEVTYNLHIILRYEIERALLEGTLAVKDLPAVWNQKFSESFGITPPSDREGCLQDIHWSCGAIGYFPTYTLGNCYAAQFMEAIRKENPDLDTKMAVGDFSAIRKWLSRCIYQQGQTLWPDELCHAATGNSLQAEPLIKHLQSKVSTYYR